MFILRQGPCIAKITSPLQFKNFLPNGFDADDYIVQIPAGVDAALVVAMVLAYDEMEEWD